MGTDRGAGKVLLEPFRRFCYARFKTPRASFRAYRNQTVFIHDKNTVRPGVIVIRHYTIQSVNDTGYVYIEFGDAQMRISHTLEHGFRRINFLFVFDCNGPIAIRGVGLSYIHHIKFGTIAIFFVQLIQRANLTPKRRSRVAAKNQHNRFLAAKRCQLNFAQTIHRL